MIRLEKVSKIYPGSQVKVVDELDLHIKAGEICVLVGASGCGKTTTMRMINRLIEHTSGSIFVDGKDITTMNPIELRLNIGYVIQETGLFPHYTIEKNIATVPIEKKWPKQKIEARVKELMGLVDLDYDTFAKKRPSSLSGGQRQRVGVARALAADPPIMLMDEPFGALDPITRAKLQNEFLNIQERIKKTIVFVTHDIDEAVKMGDKIAVMQYGRLAQFGSPHEILSKPANEFVENLVGENRILKRFSLIKCTKARIRTTSFKLNQERERLVAYMEGKERLSSYQIVGVTTDEGHPIGYIPLFKYEPGDLTPIEDRIVKTEKTVTQENTLYDALGILFSTGHRGVFCLDEDNRSIGLVTMTDLFEAVQRDE